MSNSSNEVAPYKERRHNFTSQTFVNMRDRIADSNRARRDHKELGRAKVGFVGRLLGRQPGPDYDKLLLVRKHDHLI